MSDHPFAGGDQLRRPAMDEKTAKVVWEWLRINSPALMERIEKRFNDFESDESDTPTIVDLPPI